MISRRALVQALSILGVSPALASERSSTKKTLVIVFLRGAVDGLSMVPPTGDPALSALRPSLGLEHPLRLDATFGLHPAMSALSPLFSSKRLAFVHATGLPQQPRSHFDAQDFLESGTPGRRAGDGWLNRAGRALSERTPLSLVALQNALPVSLTGNTPALAFASPPLTRPHAALLGARGILRGLQTFQLARTRIDAGERPNVRGHSHLRRVLVRHREVAREG